MQNNSHLNGLILINKPSGFICKDISRLIIKRFPKLKLGHVGTLDPLAEGVVPILVGSYTKLQDYFLEYPKEYLVELCLGFETDTLDLEGKLVHTKSWKHVNQNMILELLKSLVGSIEYIPPIYSAVKYKGKPLYKYARSNSLDKVDVNDLKRKVHIFAIKDLDIVLPIIKFRIICSKGTYIRSIVQHIGKQLGSCATLTKLIRTKASGYSIKECLKLEYLNDTSLSIENIILSNNDDIRLPFKSLVLDNNGAIKKFTQGNTIILKKDYFYKNLNIPCNDVLIYSNNFNANLFDKYIFIKSVSKIIGIGILQIYNSSNIKISPKRIF